MKRAFLIGITDYPLVSSDWRALGGPVNDITDYNEIFLKLGFQNIVTLVNAQATGEAIRKGFQEIIKETKVKLNYKFTHFHLVLHNFTEQW